jgi:acyl-CoA thioesterase
MPTPFVDHVGVQIKEMHEGSSLLTLNLAPCHFNSSGIAHGGVMFTLADTGMGAALMSALHATETCATIEVKINYFRPVTEGLLVCRSHILYRGNSTASLEATLHLGEKIVCKAMGTFAIFPKRTGKHSSNFAPE